MGFKYYLEEGSVYRKPPVESIDSPMQIMDAVTREWHDLLDRNIGFHAMWFGSQITEEEALGYQFIMQDIF